jgi:tetratricopeptide (TPR) repeat protein
MGRASRDVGKLGQSSELLKEAQTRDGPSIDKLLLLAGNARESGDFEKALEFLKSARTLNNKVADRLRDPRVEAEYAAVLESMGGDQEKALGKSYLKALKEDKNYELGVKAFDQYFEKLDDRLPLDENKSNLDRLDEILDLMKKDPKKSGEFDVASLEKRLADWKSSRDREKIDDLVKGQDYKKALTRIAKEQKKDFSPELELQKALILEKTGEYAKARASYKKLLDKGALSKSEYEGHKERLKESKKGNQQIDDWNQLANDLDAAGKSKEAAKYRARADKEYRKLFRKIEQKKKKKLKSKKGAGKKDSEDSDDSDEDEDDSE